MRTKIEIAAVALAAVLIAVAAMPTVSFLGQVVAIKLAVMLGLI